MVSRERLAWAFFKKRHLIILLFVCSFQEKVYGDKSTDPPLFTTLYNTENETNLHGDETQLKNITVIIKNSQNDDVDENLHSDTDLNSILKELGHISDQIETIQEEHSHISHGIVEMTKVVRDMNERSDKIKKKVKKLTKNLSKGSNHDKIKSKLRNLQKDHKQILETMKNSTKIKSHSSNHHKNKKHRKRKQRKHCKGENCSKDKKKRIKKNYDEESQPSSTAALTNLTGSNEDSGPNSSSDDESTEKYIPKDCNEVLQFRNYTSGVYTVQPTGFTEVKQVWCDQETQGGGWTMIVSRKQSEPQQDFNLDWESYKKGFGDPSKEYWVGNAALHSMTKEGRYELRVNITDWKDQEVWAEWKEFSVGSEEEGYPLSVSRYASGSNAGDALKWHNAMRFSTKDKDNDALMGGHCARKNRGGWWYRGYRGCYQAHPTGQYQDDPMPPPKNQGKRNFDLGPVLAWQNWRGENFFPKTLFLMFRPAVA